MKKYVGGNNAGNGADNIGKQSVRHRIAGLDYTHATEVDGKDVECSVGTALDCR